MLNLTKWSTSMFLNEDQLVDLCNFNPGLQKKFVWRSLTPVTINRTNYRHNFDREAVGLKGETYEDGMISHFAKLLTR